MNRMKNRSALIGAMFIVASTTYGTPSGIKGLPSDVVIPNYQGRPLPVEILPHANSDTTLYLKPTEGVFVNQGVVKSPLAKCELVKEELKISEINTQARVKVANLLRQAQIDYAKSQEELKKIVREEERLAALQVPLQNQATDAEKEKKEVVTAISTTKDEITEKKESLIIIKDKSQIEKVNKEVQSLETKLDGLARDFVAAGKKARQAKLRLNEIELALAESKGRHSGIEKTLFIQTDQIGKIQDQLDRVQAASEEVLKKYSSRVGAYTTYTADFAPAAYIQAMKEKNPKYSFQFVPSVTATIDATIAGQLKAGSALESATGTLILDAKWSDAEAARTKKAFRKHLLESSSSIADPVKLAQTQIAEFENSLTGTKFLSLQLSVLGYCALKEPASLSEEFTGGAKDTFKLALYYTYPVNYALTVKGRYNSYATLYEFHKKTKSSSWFGLSKSEKVEHIRNMSSGKTIEVEVKPLGGDFNLRDSQILTEKVKEQLIFFSLERFLDRSKSLPPALTSMEDSELGASSTGKRLMMVPNPYAFWAGLVLVSLGEMFGSSSQEQIQQVSDSSWIDLKYTSGFNMLVPADLTVGNLTQAKLVNKLEQ